MASEKDLTPDTPPAPCPGAPQEKDSAEALALIWAMVTTHPKWLGANAVVPYDDIDCALNLTRGNTQFVWENARGIHSSTSVPDTGNQFQSLIGAALPPTPGPGPIQPTPGSGWSGKECRRVGHFVRLLNTTIDPQNFPTVTG